MSVAVDSSVLVAGVASWHEHHEVAARLLNRLLDADDLLIPVPALIETYSVLTRLPAPFRVSPGDAEKAVRGSYGQSRLAGFPTRNTWSFLEELAERGIGGGVTYDAVIVRAAVSGQARSLCTFNPRHFHRFADQIEIIDPSETR